MPSSFEDEHTDYPSRYKIGSQVMLRFGNVEISECYIRTVTFTNGKVRYAVKLMNDGLNTTIHNIDSAFVIGVTDPKFIEFEFDNYS